MVNSLIACTHNLARKKRLDKEVTDDSRCLHLGHESLRRRRSERSASFKRLLKVAESLTLHPQASIPKAAGNWGDAKAAYRLLNEPDVTPDALQGPHRQVVAAQCAELPMVLCLQDASDLDFTFRNGTAGLGKIGDGKGRGLIQHTALVVEPQHGRTIGLLHQSWHKRVERDPKETAKQRLARWRESDIWADTIRAVGLVTGRWGWGQGPRCRLVHVMDSHGDCFTTFTQARRQNVDLIARVMHYDRKLADGASLEKHLAAQPAIGQISVTLHEQRDERNRVKHPERKATLEARVATALTLPPPAAGEPPVVLNAIVLSELDPPPGQEPVRWMILTTLAVDTLAAVQAVVNYYALRWRIEEFHRAEKEGCAVEEAQFDEATDLMRLASVKSVIAVRLLQLRDQAHDALREPAKLDTPARLAQIVPAAWIAVVAGLAKIEASTLTVSQFYRRVAMRGGWLGRKSDGTPGWKTLWRGWSELYWLVQGYELAMAKKSG